MRGRPSPVAAARAWPPAPPRLLLRARSTISLPSLATYSGSKPSISQAACTAGRTGMACLVQLDPDVALRGDLVQGGGQPAAGGVAQHVHAAARPRQHGADQAVERGHVRLRRRSRSPARRARQHGDAVIAERAGDQHHVARLGHALRRSARPAGTQPTPVVDDEQPVGLASLGDLGVAGDDLHAGLLAPRPCIDATTRSSVASGRPSSRMKPAVRYSGLAPMTWPGR